jgi:putative protease
VIYDEDIENMKQLVDFAKSTNIDAIIASDFAVIEYACKQNVTVHCSTQLNISNSHSLEYYAKFAEVIVLARELNLAQVLNIYKYINENQVKSPSGNLVRIEMFIHGALCMAISGKCYLSLHEQNRSANRGACVQVCRRSYRVTVDEKINNDNENYEQEIEQENQLEIDNKYIMSTKDLCTIFFLDRILQAGARVLKIEGRGRSPEYVKRVVECYNQAIEAIIANTYSKELIDELTVKLSEVFNRGFWDGYYLGRKLGEWSERHSSSATKRKEFIGVCTNYFSRIEVGEFIVQTGKLNIGDDVVIIGPTTGVLEIKVIEMHDDSGNIECAKKGQLFAIPVSEKIRRNDKLYKLVEHIEY